MDSRKKKLPRHKRQRRRPPPALLHVRKRRRIIPYHPWLVPLARNLRNNSTTSEILLWQHLKRWQMHGYDFHRQRPVDRYILDFFCVELMLAIEIDGMSHELKNRRERDVERQNRLEQLVIYIMRFDDLEVKQNMDKVLDSISNWIEMQENS
ncbi:MAG: endonuclease domain-containing protein [Bacteroidota bacterium]